MMEWKKIVDFTITININFAYIFLLAQTVILSLWIYVQSTYCLVSSKRFFIVFDFTANPHSHHSQAFGSSKIWHCN
jgi:hypothetical protein